MDSFTVGNYTVTLKAGVVVVTVTATGDEIGRAYGAQAKRLWKAWKDHAGA